MTLSIWKPPSDLPNLLNASIISIDTETNDPNLKKLGPGGVRNDGHLAGISIATDTGFVGYFPIGHASGNMDKKTVISWLKKQLSTNIPKCGANLLYDLEWLHTEGVKVSGPLYDVQIAEPLLNENKLSFALQSLAIEYLGEQKEEKLLEEAAEAYGLKNTKQELWKLPSKYVGAYAEQDAVLPMKIFEKQKEKLKKEELWELFLMESKLQSILFKMRIKGVAVDINKAEMLYSMWETEENLMRHEMKKLTGKPIDIWSNKNIAKAYISLGLPFILTDKGNPSFTQKWLSFNASELSTLILHARLLNKARNAFVKNMILEHSKDGRIYTQFHQLRRDDVGTVSGRFSSSNPNLQQVPARNTIIGPQIRSIFVPDKGLIWGKFDYSQQEPRVAIHYASLFKFEGAEEAAQKFRDYPGTDYHKMIADMANIGRSDAKTLNLGIMYGMGHKKIIEQLDVSDIAARDIITKYHEKVPFIRRLQTHCSHVASTRGYIKTILGRKRRFDLFERIGEKDAPLPRAEALEAYGPRIRRAFTYKALNALIQGSSADMIKRAIILLDEAGYTPQLTVHDEIDLSIEGPEQAQEIKKIMQECMPEITIPILCNAEMGPNWGNVR